MKLSVAKLLAGLVVAWLALPAATAGAAGSPPTTVPPVRSPSSVPAVPIGSRVVGSVPGASVFTVDVALRPRDPAALDSFASAVSTPGSSVFRHYLPPGSFASTFGPEPATISAVRSWLSSKGLEVGATSPDGLIVPASGSAETFGRAFGVGFEQYRLPSGRIARMPTAAPLVPADLAAQVTGVVGLDDLARPEPQLVHAPIGSATPRFSASGPSSTGSPAATSGADTVGPRVTSGPQVSCSALTAAGLSATQLAQAYSFSSLYGSGDEGQGVTVGVYELEPYLPSDISAYEGCYSPAITASVQPVSVNGASPTLNSGSGESALDVEMAVGMAPQVTVDVYVGSDLGTGASNADALSTYAAMVNQDAVKVISTSWGECERDLGPAQIQAEASLFEQAVAQGQTITAPAGDSGSEDCFGDGTTNDQVLAVDDPATQPWVTTVGGTTLNSFGPPPSELVWDNFSGAGGGGISSMWTMPTWQVGPGVKNAFTSSASCPMSSGAGTSSCREVPDVSADADPVNSPFAEYVGGTWEGVGGTSMGSPMWAALTALADEGQASSVGFIDPALYAAGCLTSPPFNDITAGNNQPPAPYLPTDANGVPLTGGPYYPTAGHYDLASGLGTPIAGALVPDLRTPVASPCSTGPPPPCNTNDRAVSASGHSARVIQTTSLGFTPLASPVRIADTRSGATDPSKYAGDTLCPGGSLTVDIPAGDVPPAASAIVAQLSAVTPTSGGFLSVYPAGTPVPGTSNVNFVAGQDVGNLVTVALGTDATNGSLAVSVLNGPAGTTGPDTDMTLDLYGYYAPQSAGSGDPYVPLTPARIFDTRQGSGQPGQGQTLTNGGSVQVPVLGLGGVPSSGVSAVVVNIGVTNTTAPSFIQGYPTGSPPSSSTPTVDQNWVGGETLSTKAIIGVGSGGSITLANHDANVDVVVDVDGYFGAPGASGALLNVLPTPVRLADTRPGGVAGGASYSVAVAGTQGVPATATAGVLDVIDLATQGNFLTVYPAGQSAPFAADVNYVSADTDTIVANAAFGTIGSSGSVDVYNGPSTTTSANIVVDEFGYFS